MIPETFLLTLCTAFGSQPIADAGIDPTVIEKIIDAVNQERNSPHGIGMRQSRDGALVLVATRRSPRRSGC